MKEGGQPRNTPRPGSLAISNGVPSQATVFITYESMAVQDSYLYSLAERLDKYGEDGIYLDGTGHLPSGANLEIGAGYMRDGKLVETYPTFAVRKFMQRIYNVVKSRRPDGIIDLHCSFAVIQRPVHMLISYGQVSTGGILEVKELIMSLVNFLLIWQELNLREGSRGFLCR